MRLNNLYEAYKQRDNIKIFSKDITVEDKIYETVGFSLKDNTLSLIVFEYNSSNHEDDDEFYDEAIYDKKQTNREEQKEGLLRNENSLIENIREVIIDEITYNVEGASGRGLNLDDYEDVMFITDLFNKGWVPKNIGEVSSKYIVFNSIRIEGEFEDFPAINEDSKIILKKGITVKTSIVEKPITLEVNKEYNEKIHYTANGEKHWININSVKRYDVMKEVMKNFEDPRFKEFYSEEELNKLIESTKESILKTCPQGKFLLLVEYESDKDEGIRLFTKDWLNREVSRSNSMIGIAIRNKEKVCGKLGKVLNYELIQEAFDDSIISVEVELFAHFNKITPSDIVF